MSKTQELYEYYGSHPQASNKEVAEALQWDE